MNTLQYLVRMLKFVIKVCYTGSKRNLKSICTCSAVKVF